MAASCWLAVLFFIPVVPHVLWLNYVREPFRGNEAACIGRVRGAALFVCVFNKLLVVVILDFFAEAKLKKSAVMKRQKGDQLPVTTPPPRWFNLAEDPWQARAPIRGPPLSSHSTSAHESWFSQLGNEIRLPCCAPRRWTNHTLSG